MRDSVEIIEALRLDASDQSRIDLLSEYRKKSTKHLVAGVGFVALSGVGFEQDGWAAGLFGLSCLASAGLAWCYQNINTGIADLLEEKGGFNALMAQNILTEELSDKI